MFKNAPKLPKGKEPPGKKRERLEVALTSETARLAELDFIIKAATAERAALMPVVLDSALSIFMGKLKNDPTDMDAYVERGVNAEVNFALRRRAANSPLNPDEIEILTKAKIPVSKEIISPELFAINPEYATNATLLRKVKKALEGIVPKDFIVKQEETRMFVVTDESLAAAFKKPNLAIMKLVTTVQTKPTLMKVELMKLNKALKTAIDNFFKPEK